jgi:hypothetical protein
MRVIAFLIGALLYAMAFHALQARRTRFIVDAYRDIESRQFWAIVSCYLIAGTATLYRAGAGFD